MRLPLIEREMEDDRVGTEVLELSNPGVVVVDEDDEDEDEDVVIELGDDELIGNFEKSGIN